MNRVIFLPKCFFAFLRIFQMPKHRNNSSVTLLRNLTVEEFISKSFFKCKDFCVKLCEISPGEMYFCFSWNKTENYCIRKFSSVSDAEAEIQFWPSVYIMMMVVLTLVHVREGRRGGKCGRIWWEEEGNADYGGIVQPSQQHVGTCVKVVEVWARKVWE